MLGAIMVRPVVVVHAPCVVPLAAVHRALLHGKPEGYATTDRALLDSVATTHAPIALAKVVALSHLQAKTFQKEFIA